MAADGISGELLWKVKVESVVAAVYGVGKESTWIPLEVIDESDVFTHGHSNPVSRQGSGLLGTSSSSVSLAASNSGGGLVPYGESDQFHRLGRYQTSIFVSSKFDPLGLDSSSFSENEYEELHIDPELPLQPPTNIRADGFSLADSSILSGKTPDIMLDQSHSTEHGLYLTWSIVYGIVAVLIAVIVFVRTKYVRQKRKWENTPSLDPTTAPSGSEDGVGRDRSLNSDGILLPPAAPRVNNMDRMWRSQDRQPVSRSLSLGAMTSPSGAYESKHFISVAAQDNDNVSMPILNNEKSNATTTAATPTISGIPAINHANTLPEDSSSDKAQLQKPDNIDGIPLVRYPRFQSEFDQKNPLGRGGFGTVFQCENALDGSQYAIKKIRIKSQLDLDGKVTKRFSQKLHRVLREVKILALLDHANIVRYCKY